MGDLTIVTGIWDLGRDRAGPGFERPFDHYRAKFAQLLEADVPMVVFGDESLRGFVHDHRDGRPTDFRVRPASYFRSNFDIRSVLEAIFTSPTFLAPQTRFGLIKSPVEFAVMTMRSLDAPMTAVRDLPRDLARMDRICSIRPM